MKNLSLGPCFSSHPVNFALLGGQERIYTAYYKPGGQLTVDSLTPDGQNHCSATLPEHVGWDSHNGLTLAQDHRGHLHLSGNMHGDPLIYFRTTRAGDITSFERIPAMTGTREKRVTYPLFFSGPGQTLYFTYRDGSSGDGDQITLSYNPEFQKWHSVLAGPIVSGGGFRNAYLDGPLKGPDGFFHLCWVWREEYDASTCRDVCYARSRDLVDWEDSHGHPLKTPILMEHAEVVDAIPIRQGLINGNVRLGFDGEGQVVITYHKLDEAGHNQIRQARKSASGWDLYQSTHWEQSWHPEGEGTLIYSFRVGPLRVAPSGQLRQSVRFADNRSETWELDPDTLQILGILPTPISPPDLPVTPGLLRRWLPEILDEPALALTWESLPENQDRPRDAFHPGSLLQLIIR